MVNQLMAALSVADIFGSIAYAFTTLPTPTEDFIQGAVGNQETCTAQGFFIQLGTTSAYINVSLSIYYLLVLKYGWSERKIKKVKPFFFIFPIVVGLTFAFAGIPFYDNMVLWCNNAAEIWPEIPMVIAIFVATVVMSTICWHVYQNEKRSSKWKMGGSGNNGQTMTKKVFSQAMWYLAAFNMTWPPYLALQFLWASGKAFSSYGFVLYASSVVPLQGFWNLIVYLLRTRMNVLDLSSTRSKMSKHLSRTTSMLRASGKRVSAVFPHHKQEEV